tara:strand:+ start:3267 stop:7382 length:4116 start_codon:yes stop_codon:yes gene_type:complete
MFVKNINKNIQKALKTRERAMSRRGSTANSSANNELSHNDLMSRTVFIRMASNMRNQENVVLLQNGVMDRQQDDAGRVTYKTRKGAFGYTKNIENEIRPISGIKDITVQYKGGYKAIRTAEIKWTAGSLDELEILTPHFLTVGKSVMLDWGYIYKNATLNEKVIKNSFWRPETVKEYGVNPNPNYLGPQDHPIDQSLFNSNNIERILKCDGNYDAIGGMISNFDYSLQEDGSFDCTTILTSFGINMFDSKRIDRESNSLVTAKNKDNKLIQFEASDCLINSIINLPRIIVHDYFGAPSKFPKTTEVTEKAFTFEKGDPIPFNLFVLIDKFHAPAAKLGKDPNFDSLFCSLAKSGWSIISEENENKPGGNYVLTKKSTTGIPDQHDVVISKMSTYVASDVSPVERWIWKLMFTASTRFYGEDYWASMNRASNQFAGNDAGVEANYTSALGIEGTTSDYIDLRNRNDIFVRWGWFEDNILSRYTTYYDSTGELINPFRSVETVIDSDGTPMKDGNGQQMLRNVRIRNDSKYLLPKDPLKFFLPGQTLKSSAVGFARGLNTEIEDSVKAYDSLMNINSGDQNPYRWKDPNNPNYGILRNVMVNVKEIQKAFGIEDLGDLPYIGAVHGKDKVIVPSHIKTAVKNLLSSLSENFFNYWKFEITEDKYNLNLKIIEKDTIAADLKYTQFTENSSDVKEVGIYKFPAFSSDSMVRDQQLSFKIPDSMAVQTMYGANKNKKDGIIVDTSQDGYGLDAFTAHHTSNLEDNKYNNLEIAYKKDVTGHSIGNSNKNAGDDIEGERDANNKITNDGSFRIRPTQSTHWWNVYDAEHKSADSTKGVDLNDETLEAKVKEAKATEDARKLKLKYQERLRNAMKTQIDFLLTGDGDDLEDSNNLISKIQNLGAEIALHRREQAQFTEQAASMTLNYKNQRNLLGKAVNVIKGESNQVSYTTFASQRDKILVKARKEETQVEKKTTKLSELQKKLDDMTVMNKFYTPVKSDDENLTIRIESAVHNIIRERLFAFNTENMAWQKHILIPAELGLTIDGIGGLTPGDIIQTDYMPSLYNSEVLLEDNKTEGPRTFFQIFNIVQKVDGGGWSTEFETKMRLNNQALKDKVVPPLTFEQPNPLVKINDIAGASTSSPVEETIEITDDDFALSISDEEKSQIYDGWLHELKAGQNSMRVGDNEKARLVVNPNSLSEASQKKFEEDGTINSIDLQRASGAVVDSFDIKVDEVVKSMNDLSLLNKKIMEESKKNEEQLDTSTAAREITIYPGSMRNEVHHLSEGGTIYGHTIGVRENGMVIFWTYNSGGKRYVGVQIKASWLDNGGRLVETKEFERVTIDNMNNINFTRNKNVSYARREALNYFKNKYKVVEKI